LVRCGAYGAGNKGAIATSLTVHSTSFCLVNSHLAAGEVEGNAADRLHNILNIASTLRLDAKSDSNEASARSRFANVGNNVNESRSFLEHDVILWAGDFNSRLWKDSSMSEPLAFQDAFRLLETTEGLTELLLNHDEMHIQRQQSGPFNAFEEAPITFLPTYKFVPETRRSVLKESPEHTLTETDSPHLDVDVSGDLRRSSSSNNLARMRDKASSLVPKVRRERSQNNNVLDDVPLTQKHSNAKTYQLGDDVYNVKKVPAYCDRVVWRTRSTYKVQPGMYERIEGVTFSDHKPVRLCVTVGSLRVYWGRLGRLCSELDHENGTPSSRLKPTFTSGPSELILRGDSLWGLDEVEDVASFGYCTQCIGNDACSLL